MAVDQLPAQAPEFTLDHVLGHSVSLSEFRGQRVVVLFGGKDSSEQVRTGIATIRSSYTPQQLKIINVADVRSAPRPLRMVVRGQLKKAYEEAVKAQTVGLQAAGQPAPADPSKEIIMLTDWSGKVADSFGVSGVDREAAAVAVQADGCVLGAGSGAELGEQIVALLAG